MNTRPPDQYTQVQGHTVRYWTQGDTLQDLVEHLKDLYSDLSGGCIPGARKVGELVMP
jgi:hypothetical protein